MLRNGFAQERDECAGPFNIKYLALESATKCSSNVFVDILERSPNLLEFSAKKSSNFDDTCCEALMACPNLEILDLMSTKITNAGT